MVRKRRFEIEEDAVHSELTAIIARHQVAELAADAELRSRQGQVPSAHRRPSLRTRLGWRLTRWGTRLAPPPTVPARRTHPAPPASMAA
jgi:hypothetical protein